MIIFLHLKHSHFISTQENPCFQRRYSRIACHYFLVKKLQQYLVRLFRAPSHSLLVHESKTLFFQSKSSVSDTKKTNNGSGGEILNCSTNFVACHHPLRDLCTFLICFFFQLNIVLAFKRFVEKLELLFLCFLCFSLQVQVSTHFQFPLFLFKIVFCSFLSPRLTQASRRNHVKQILPL